MEYAQVSFRPRHASFIFLSSLAGHILAENGLDGWLRYAPLPPSLASHFPSDFPSSIIALNSSVNSPVYTATQELQKGFQGILHRDIDIVNSTGDHSHPSSVLIGTVEAYTNEFGTENNWGDLIEDGFWPNTSRDSIQIVGQNERGALYGTFEYLLMLAQGNFADVAYTSNPHAPIRWANQWDNLNRSIERGYGGTSIFFKNGIVMTNLTRAAKYARLLASIGLNAVVVNNVNANSSLLTQRTCRVSAGLQTCSDRMVFSLVFH